MIRDILFCNLFCAGGNYSGGPGYGNQGGGYDTYNDGGNLGGTNAYFSQDLLSWLVIDFFELHSQ